MEIKVNNISKNIQEGCSLQSLVEEILPGKPISIAVAINNIVIPRSGWSNRPLQTNDDILIINATQGG